MNIHYTSLSNKRTKYGLRRRLLCTRQRRPGM